jgi:hypothetical protein
MPGGTFVVPPGGTVCGVAGSPPHARTFNESAVATAHVRDFGLLENIVSILASSGADQRPPRRALHENERREIACEMLSARVGSRKEIDLRGPRIFRSWL